MVPSLLDHRLRPARAVMHEAPGRSWGLEDLAHAASMSRTTFATRFRAVSGMTPLTYLGQWRMLLAQRALHDADVSMRSLATHLGYTSESAFSVAFKRIVGEAPAHYRDRLRHTRTRHVGHDPRLQRTHDEHTDQALTSTGHDLH